jgi:hypothetical protein
VEIRVVNSPAANIQPHLTSEEGLVMSTVRMRQEIKCEINHRSGESWLSLFGFVL